MPLDILKRISGIFGVDITKQQWFKDYIVSPLSSIGDWVNDKITLLKDSILILLNKTIPDAAKGFLPTSLKESMKKRNINTKMIIFRCNDSSYFRMMKEKNIFRIYYFK